MKPKAVTNNAAVVFTSLVAYALENAPRGLCPRSRNDGLAKLEDPECARDFQTLEFMRGSAKVELRLGFESFHYEHVEYEDVEYEDDTFIERKIRVQLGWYSGGSNTCAEAIVFAGLLEEVARFAIEIESCFSDTYHQLLVTKAQREETARVNALREFTARLRGAVLIHMKGKRPGASVDGLDPRHFLVETDLAQLQSSGSTFMVSETPSGGGRQFEVVFTGFDAGGDALTAGQYGRWPTCTIRRLVIQSDAEASA